MDGKLLNEQHLVSIIKRRVHRLTCAYSCQKPHCWKFILKTEELKYSVTDPARECCCHQRDQTNQNRETLFQKEKFNKNKNNSLFNSYNNKCRVRDSN